MAHSINVIGKGRPGASIAQGKGSKDQGGTPSDATSSRKIRTVLTRLTSYITKSSKNKNAPARVRRAGSLHNLSRDHINDHTLNQEHDQQNAGNLRTQQQETLQRTRSFGNLLPMRTVHERVDGRPRSACENALHDSMQVVDIGDKAGAAFLRVDPLSVDEGRRQHKDNNIRSLSSSSNYWNGPCIGTAPDDNRKSSVSAGSFTSSSQSQGKASWLGEGDIDGEAFAAPGLTSGRNHDTPTSKVGRILTAAFLPAHNVGDVPSGIGREIDYDRNRNRDRMASVASNDHDGPINDLSPDEAQSSDKVVYDVPPCRRGGDDPLHDLPPGEEKVASDRVVYDVPPSRTGGNDLIHRLPPDERVSESFKTCRSDSVNRDVLSHGKDDDNPVYDFPPDEEVSSDNPVYDSVPSSYSKEHNHTLYDVPPFVRGTSSDSSACDASSLCRGVTSHGSSLSFSSSAMQEAREQPLITELQLLRKMILSEENKHCSETLEDPVKKQLCCKLRDIPESLILLLSQTYSTASSPLARAYRELERTAHGSGHSARDRSTCYSDAGTFRLVEDMLYDSIRIATNHGIPSLLTLIQLGDKICRGRVSLGETEQGNLERFGELIKHIRANLSLLQYNLLEIRTLYESRLTYQPCGPNQEEYAYLQFGTQAKLHSKNLEKTIDLIDSAIRVPMESIHAGIEEAYQITLSPPPLPSAPIPSRLQTATTTELPSRQKKDPSPPATGTFVQTKKSRRRALSVSSGSRSRTRSKSHTNLSKI